MQWVLSQSGTLTCCHASGTSLSFTLMSDGSNPQWRLGRYSCKNGYPAPRSPWEGKMTRRDLQLPCSTSTRQKAADVIAFIVQIIRKQRVRTFLDMSWENINGNRRRRRAVPTCGMEMKSKFVFVFVFFLNWSETSWISQMEKQCVSLSRKQGVGYDSPV